MIGTKMRKSKILYKAMFTADSSMCAHAIIYLGKYLQLQSLQHHHMKAHLSANAVNHPKCSFQPVNFSNS